MYINAKEFGIAGSIYALEFAQFLALKLVKDLISILLM
jgi:hypothetical protein